MISNHFNYCVPPPGSLSARCFGLQQRQSFTKTPTNAGISQCKTQSIRMFFFNAMRCVRLSFNTVELSTVVQRISNQATCLQDGISLRAQVLHDVDSKVLRMQRRGIAFTDES